MRKKGLSAAKTKTVSSLSSSLKEVAESNFTLHEMHCKRFLCLCPDCNETIPKEHLNQHREEQHTQVYTVYTHNHRHAETHTPHDGVVFEGLQLHLFAGQMLKM